MVWLQRERVRTAENHQQDIQFLQRRRVYELLESTRTLIVRANVRLVVTPFEARRVCDFALGDSVRSLIAADAGHRLNQLHQRGERSRGGIWRCC